MPTISVIIPTYNRIDLIGRALCSVYAQNDLITEVIVVDDGSTDRTVSLVKAKFPKVLVISQERCGVSHARNRGIEAAQGEWLAFLDSDDKWLKSKIRLQIDTIRKDPKTRFVHSDEIWIRHGKRVNPMKKHKKQGGYIFKDCLKRCLISPSSTMLHRSIFEEFGEFDENLQLCEDYDFWLRITAILPVSYIPTPLIQKYGGHSDQLSRSQWGIDRYRIQSLEKIIASKALTPEQTRHTLDELLIKLDIYLKGAYRRQRFTEIESYERKKTFYKKMQLNSQIA